jgi:hypothetical protein
MLRNKLFIDCERPLFRKLQKGTPKKEENGDEYIQENGICGQEGGGILVRERGGTAYFPSAKGGTISDNN